jgi:hypothetical protein
MPRPARRAKSRRAGYDQHHVNHLLRGVYLHHGCGFATIPPDANGDCTDFDAMRKAWELMRADLLAKWIREKPGTRPYAWWKFDAPERRQRTDNVVHPFDDRVRRRHVEEVGRKNPVFRRVAYELFYGKPRCLCVKDDFTAQYESETTYLYRLNLLTDAERKELFHE